MDAIDLDDTPAVLWLEAYRHAKEEIARWTLLAEQAEQAVQAVLGDAGTGRLNGKPVVYWRYEREPRRQISTTLLKERYPEIAEEVTVVAAQPRRPFKLAVDRW